MRCTHNVVGGCVACDFERWQASNAVKTQDMLMEIGQLVHQLAGTHGIDTAKLGKMLEMLPKAGLR